MTDEWPGQRLHQYAIFDRHDAMIDILQGEERRNINARDRCGRTPVYTAVSNNSIKCLEILLQHGADPSIAGGERVRKMTPLHQALLECKLEAIKLLLQYGADLNRVDETGMTPVNLAKSIGVKNYIEIFEQEDDRRRQNAMRVVADLYSASETGDLARVKDILRVPPPAGLELATIKLDNLDKSPLIIAIEKNHDDDITVELLRSVTQLPLQPSIIHLAVEMGQLNIVEHLIKKFPECCKTKDDSDQLPLHVACETGSSDIVKLLLESDYPDSVYQSEYDQQKHVEYNMPFNVNDVSVDGKSSLFLACENGYEDIVEYLLNFTVKGSYTDKISEFMSSASSGPSQIEDSDIDIKPVKIDSNIDEINKTSIQLPDHSDVSTGNSVLYRRTDLITSTSQTLTCVYIAVKNRHLQIVKKLAEFGAKFDLSAREKDVEYSLILKLALDNRDLLMLDTLLSLNVQDLNNFVFEEAVRSHPEFIAHFLKYKLSEDKANHINKKLMKKEYSAGGENMERLSSSDPRYKQIFPTESVNLRWQNLKVLSTVEPSWLVTAVNTLNPSLSSLNSRIPLFAVTRVDVSHNKITMVPIALLRLPSLCTLIASHNEITEFPSQSNFALDAQFLEELDVQYNSLSTIPTYIFTLPKLRVLNVSHNKIQKLPVSLWQSLYLKTVDLSYNRLDQLPRPVEMSARKESQESIASENQYESLPDSILEENDQSNSSTDSHVIIHEVKRSNHWTNDIIVCDEAVKAAENFKKGLKTLKLGKNMFSTFPEFLSCCCPQLEDLELQHNHLRTVGNLGAYPKLLRTLDLSYNEIESMGDWQIEDDRKRCFCAPRQASVVASGMFAQSAAPAICPHRNHTKLENLDTLDLSHNKLTTMIVLRSCDITHSQSVNLSDREAIQKNIQGKLLFPNITTLILDMNSLTHLSDDIKEMQTLKSLSLKQNLKLKELPPELGLLDRLQRLELEMCPLEGPIHDVIKIANGRASDITGFLRSILEDSQEYNSMNLMIVGSFDIGKTSLLQQLMKRGKTSTKMMNYMQRQDSSATFYTKDGNPLSTVGIDINHLILEGKHGTVEFRTWDFAGQTEYYATHQYFLSPRSLYLVVWDLTKGEPGVEELRQWLVNIQAQAPGSPVIIVGTHLDEIQKRKKNFPANWEKSMNELIREKYKRFDNYNIGLPLVIDVVNVATAKKIINMDKLQRLIYDTVFHLKHPSRKSENLLGHKVPKKYMKLQSVISEIVRHRKNNNKEPVCDSNSYLLTVMEEMSKDETMTGFRNKEDLNQATRFLHENGVLCHFEDMSLRDQYFLEPQWLCDQLARVVSIKEVQQYCKNGIMKLKDMFQLYRNSDRIGQYILSLLNKFEVALQFDSEHLLLPSLLPTDSNLMPEDMREIPVRRKGAPINVMNESITSQGTIGKLFSSINTISSGEQPMYIVSTQPASNPAFSNTRLYLLTYFPSGFWPRLITRILADEFFYDPLMRMYQFPQDIVDKCPDIQKETPNWRCWQTGFELVYFGNVIMQVKEVRNMSNYARGMCNYTQDDLKIECHFDSQWGELDIKDSVILEISFKADKITYFLGHDDLSGAAQFRSIEPRDVYHDEKAKTAVLAKVVEHIDCLLQDWFPEIGESRFIQSCQGRYLVTRVVICPLCLQAEINYQDNPSGAWEYCSLGSESTHLIHIQSNEHSLPKNPPTADPADVKIEVKHRVMCTFLVEKCIKNVLEGLDEICKVHGSVSPSFMPGQDGVTRLIHIAPDAVFQDLDETFVVEDDAIQATEKLGQGAFGTVSKGILKRSEHLVIDVAVKVLYDPNSKQHKKTNQTTQICLETICAAYTTARQEVSILQTVEHPHIVPLLGLSRRPLALILALAPLGSLHSIFEDRYKDGLRLPVWVIRQIVIQVADALDYIHNRHIIYRDLKSDNVLAWNLPGPNDLDPKQPVLVKLADYGISKSVLPGGTKGFGGTPPFIAPEILMRTGRDTYTEKVDIFSFGMFMFELLTCRQPLAEINNINVHVVHGGRPTLKTEEAVYPSHMLDMMNICWDHDPQNRPSAAQIRMIASSPQFCHLSDAINTETKSDVLSACSVFVENMGTSDTNREQSNDHSQVWMVTSENSAVHVEILSFNITNKCIAYQEIKPDTKMLAVCSVDKNIWCIDENGTIFIYSPSKIEKIAEFSLLVNTIDTVRSMTYHHDNGGYVVILLKELQKRTTTVFCFEGKKIESCDQIQPIAVSGDCFCTAVVSSDDGYKLWNGTSRDSAVVVRNADDLDGDTKSIYAHEDPSGRQNCRFITTPVNMANTHTAWTYNYPGTKVYRWNTDLERVEAVLDCSNKIPATDSYHVQKMKRFEANHYQVTALNAIGQYLYVSTTWGCVIVADAISMEPFSVFRCHSDEEFYCKAILQLGPLLTPEQLNLHTPAPEQKPAETIYRRMPQPNTDSRDGQRASVTDKYQGVVTIGRGYCDIVKRVSRLEKQALIRRDTEDGWSVVGTESAHDGDDEISKRTNLQTFLLSWEPKNWEFY